MVNHILNKGGRRGGEAAIDARLQLGESLGDRIMKVDHAGEQGAICIYLAQRWIARWRVPDMLTELDGFLAHERRHRALFGAELERRGQRRCRSFVLCGLGGFTLGIITGLAGRGAIAATTVAIEESVLRHMQAQIAALDGIDQAATATLHDVIVDEKAHFDLSLSHAPPDSFWHKLIKPIVSGTTEAVIWLGMRL